MTNTVNFSAALQNAPCVRSHSPSSPGYHRISLARRPVKLLQGDACWLGLNRFGTGPPLASRGCTPLTASGSTVELTTVDLGYTVPIVDQDGNVINAGLVQVCSGRVPPIDRLKVWKSISSQLSRRVALSKRLRRILSPRNASLQPLRRLQHTSCACSRWLREAGLAVLSEIVHLPGDRSSPDESRIFFGRTWPVSEKKERSPTKNAEACTFQLLPFETEGASQASTESVHTDGR